ncbi:hypothetical protein GCM10011374_39630 [Kocuria dechangensis]|uniref:Cupin type-2 domain-containing protein n=2 Tax=Kocuria dechangensis TaxID=1176249 RepID=A0A917H9E6_9MICC|nr:hypothetical protein GCM10011374_39630 [Kocuria dechangensis]
MVFVGMILFFFKIETSKDQTFMDLSLFSNMTFSGATLSDFLLDGAAGTLIVSLGLVQRAAGFTSLQSGLGFYATPSTDAALSNVPDAKAGSAAGIYKMASSLGAAFGVAISAAIFAAGQTLHVTEGVGLIQARGGEVVVMRPGDTVYTPPGEEHRHGAAPEHFMTHLAMWEAPAPGDDRPETEWGAHLTDDEHLRATPPVPTGPR